MGEFAPGYLNMETAASWHSPVRDAFSSTLFQSKNLCNDQIQCFTEPDPYVSGAMDLHLVGAQTSTQYATLNASDLCKQVGLPGNDACITSVVVEWQVTPNGPNLVAGRDNSLDGSGQTEGSIDMVYHLAPVLTQNGNLESLDVQIGSFVQPSQNDHRVPLYTFLQKVMDNTTMVNKPSLDWQIVEPAMITLATLVVFGAASLKVKSWMMNYFDKKIIETKKKMRPDENHSKPSKAAKPPEHHH